MQVNITYRNFHLFIVNWAANGPCVAKKVVRRGFLCPQSTCDDALGTEEFSLAHFYGQTRTICGPPDDKLRKNLISYVNLHENIDFTKISASQVLLETEKPSPAHFFVHTRTVCGPLDHE